MGPFETEAACAVKGTTLASPSGKEAEYPNGKTCPMPDLHTAEHAHGYPPGVLWWCRECGAHWRLKSWSRNGMDWTPEWVRLPDA